MAPLKLDTNDGDRSDSIKLKKLVINFYCFLKSIESRICFVIISKGSGRPSGAVAIVIAAVVIHRDGCHFILKRRTITWRGQRILIFVGPSCGNRTSNFAFVINFFSSSFTAGDFIIGVIMISVVAELSF